MSFINEMSNLRNSLNETKKKTSAAVRQTKRDAHQLCHQAQELVQGFTAEQKIKAKTLRAQLKRTTQRLESEVKETREKNIRDQRGMRQEFVKGREVFWGAHKPKKREE